MSAELFPGMYTLAVPGRPDRTNLAFGEAHSGLQHAFESGADEATVQRQQPAAQKPNA